MLKKIFIIFILSLLFACNGENVDNCFQNSGDIITKDFEHGAFDKITVFERIELILIDGDEYKIQLETGEYLENDIDAKIEDGRLMLTNDNACNITREYGITKFYVTAPNITEIRNSSGLTVRSQNVLNYPNLTLISEDFEEEDIYHTDGPFDLNINSQSLTIVINNLSHLLLRGKVTLLNVNFYSGDARLDGRNLVAQNIKIYHRGTNDMILNPQQSITGKIVSAGDVILLTAPPIIEVEEVYTGRLILPD
ncbi:Putative auto-transporter adhesin, head GIN domain [Flavobacteriaceae bacterium MAR_2010_188]|nr:Putative auto-transporter adhesin, head GIN domain [Flavobacteriaceae bacterium MAR_2010_188]